MKNIFRIHGVPQSIISDRGPQFISKFWKRFWELLNCKPALSTAFHPETDGQTERTNQILEQYLRAYVNFEQTNWSELLYFAEFTYNNTVQASTQLTPFFANYGFHPSIDLCPSFVSTVPKAENIIMNLKRVNKYLLNSIKKSQEEQAKHANNKRLLKLYNIGDKVFLKTDNIKSTRPCKKLDFPFIGPFTIVEKINEVTYKLKLPPDYHIHNVFYVSLLEPYYPSKQFFTKKKFQDYPILVNADNELQPDYIVDSKFINEKLHYLIQWKNQPPSERSWETPETLTKHLPLIDQYHKTKRQPKRGGDVRIPLHKEVTLRFPDHR